MIVPCICCVVVVLVSYLCRHVLSCFVNLLGSGLNLGVCIQTPIRSLRVDQIHNTQVVTQR